MSAVAATKVTTNLFGERWSKLAVNCMANPLAGLSGLGSAEVRSEPVPSRIAIFVAAEAIRVGRAAGYEVEPIFGVAAQRFVDAAAGRGYAELAADMAASAKSFSGGRPSLLAGRDARAPHRDRVPERLRLRARASASACPRR